MKDAINKVGDENGLKNRWLNDDVKRSESYSTHIIEHSRYYKTFANCLDVRTVTDEYLYAMKLKSSRSYKNAMSDMIGIIKECRERNTDISFEKINKAYHDLYGTDIPEDKAKKTKDLLARDDLENLYFEMTKQEDENRQIAKTADKTITDKSIEQFISEIREQEKRNKIKERQNTTIGIDILADGNDGFGLR